jgi:hypothetical protein
MSKNGNWHANPSRIRGIETLNNLPSDAACPLLHSSYGASHTHFKIREGCGSLLAASVSSYLGGDTMLGTVEVGLQGYSGMSTREPFGIKSLSTSTGGLFGKQAGGEASSIFWASL